MVVGGGDSLLQVRAAQTQMHVSAVAAGAEGWFAGRLVPGSVWLLTCALSNYRRGPARARQLRQLS